jgi:hypothetical protein
MIVVARSCYCCCFTRGAILLSVLWLQEAKYSTHCSYRIQLAIFIFSSPRGPRHFFDVCRGAYIPVELGLGVAHRFEREKGFRA